MNSSENPPPNSSNFPKFDPPNTGEPVNTESSSPSPTSAVTESNDQTTLSRQAPIPPPSEPMQYRAIGLVRGRYSASAEHFTQGTLEVSDGTEIEAVLLGRIISLVKNHLDLEQEHLWVVYPRTRQKDGDLHLQIVGVWEPEKLDRQGLDTTESTSEEKEDTEIEEQSPPLTPRPSDEVEDGYFSVRGEIVFQSAADSSLVVKIKQAPRKESDKPKYFKLQLQGVLPTKAVGQFWDLQVKRESSSLVIQQGQSIAVLPSKPLVKKKKPYPGGGGYATGKRTLEPPRPVRKVDKPNPVQPPVSNAPKPKPVKKQKPPQ